MITLDIINSLGDTELKENLRKLYNSYYNYIDVSKYDEIRLHTSNILKTNVDFFIEQDIELLNNFVFDNKKWILSLDSTYLYKTDDGIVQHIYLDDERYLRNVEKFHLEDYGFPNIGAKKSDEWLKLFVGINEYQYWKKNESESEPEWENILTKQIIDSDISQDDFEGLFVEVAVPADYGLQEDYPEGQQITGPVGPVDAVSSTGDPYDSSQYTRSTGNYWQRDSNLDPDEFSSPYSSSEE